VILRSSDGRRGEYVPHGVAPGNGWVVVPASHQVWHIGGTLQLQIILAVPLTSGVYILSVTTPQGVTDDQSFEMAALATPVPRVRCGVVFASCGEGNASIYTMRNYGTDITKLTGNPVGDWKPSWSPGKNLLSNS